jgi:hypothetical protein
LLGLVLSTPLYADLQAFVGQDVVELADGTRIECLVVMESSRGVLIILPDPEKGEGKHRQMFIPASQVKSVTRGVRQGETKAFQTDNELAQKVIQGSGGRPDEKAKPAQPVTPTGPIAPVTPPVTQKPGGAPAPKPEQGPGKGALPPKALVDAYLLRFPQLQEAADQLLGGQSQIAEALEKALSEPATRQEAERMLELFFQTHRGEMPTGKVDKPGTVKPAPRPFKPAPAPAK